MIKQSLSPVQLHVLCDKCRKIIATNFNFLTHTPGWERVRSKQMSKSAGKGRVMDFCNEECRIVYFRGRKYFQRKQKHFQDFLKRMDGN